MHAWVILTTLVHHSAPSESDTKLRLRLLSDALAGTACREARSPSLAVRTVVGEVTIELRYIVHAPDELAAAKAADRVSALLAERAFSRVDGDISFGRPLQLG